MTIDGRPLFDPSIPGYALEEPKLSLEANKFGTLTFSIYPNHTEYANFVMKKSRIKIYNDGDLMFEARPAQRRLNFRGGLDITCEDALSRLQDVVWRPRVYGGSASDIIDWLLEEYNNMIDPDEEKLWLHVNAGEVHVDDWSMDIDFTDKAYSTIWDLLMDFTVNDSGGYLVPIYSENTGITLDYLDDDHLPVHTQTIQLGMNMTDLYIESKVADDFFTVLIPLGADTKNADPSLSSDKKLPLTIKSVNSNKIYLESDYVDSFGWIEKTHTWEKVKDASKLKTKGQKYLNKHAGQVTTTMSVSALDLHDAGFDVAPLVGTARWIMRVPVISAPHNINGNYTIRRIEVMLGSPDATKIEIGNERATVTDQMQQNTRLAREYYLSLSDRVFDLEDVEP